MGSGGPGARPPTWVYTGWRQQPWGWGREASKLGLPTLTVPPTPTLGFVVPSLDSHWPPETAIGEGAVGGTGKAGGLGLEWPRNPWLREQAR